VPVPRLHLARARLLPVGGSVIALATLLLSLSSCELRSPPANSDVEPVPHAQLRSVSALVGAGEGAQAEAALGTLLAESPGSVEAARALQDLHRERLSEPEFVALYRQRANGAPGLATNWYLLGRAVISDEEAARNHFQRALDLDPLAPWPTVGLAFLHRSRGDLFMTVETYRSALLLAPRSARLRWFLGTLYLDLQLYVDARRELGIAERLDPANPEIWGALGRAHMGLKNFGAARRDLLRSRDAMPEQPDLYVPLTELYLLWRCPEQAAQAYRSGLDFGIIPVRQVEGRLRALQLVAEEGDVVCREPIEG